MRQIFVMEQEDLARLKNGETLTISLPGGKLVEIVMDRKVKTYGRSDPNHYHIDIREKILQLLKTKSLQTHEIGQAFPEIRKPAIAYGLQALLRVEKIKFKKIKSTAPNRSGHMDNLYSIANGAAK